VYNEQVPYTVYVDIQKTRTVPYNDTYRTETYTESVPETRYREVQRVYNYTGYEHDMKLSVAFSSQLSLSNHALDLELSDASQTGGIEHDENQPTIGLMPQHPVLADPPSWLKAESSQFVSQFEKKLVDLWQATFCQSAGADEISASGDAVQKCLRQRLPQTPGFADAWYQKNFGVTAADASAVLAGGRR
jgi:hypothetical protein